MIYTEFTKKVRAKVIANKNYNKIFCIGYNKTGTTTLETILRLYGFNLPNLEEQQLRLSKNCLQTNYTEMENFVSHYDAFKDLPFSHNTTYVAADALFPDSKFILTIRDSENWFNSEKSFTKKLFNLKSLDNLDENTVLNKFNYLYHGYLHMFWKRSLMVCENGEFFPNWKKLFNKEHMINLFENRNLEIIKYFSDSDDKLLVIDISKEKTTKRICDFLNIPSEFSINMPHANKT